MRRHRLSASLGALLLRCVAEHDWSTALDGAAEEVARLGPSAVTAASQFHGITGCVWLSARPSGPQAPGGLPGLAGLRASYASATARHLRALGDLALVDDRFRRAGIGYLVVKGPVLAEHVYPRPDLREYLDLDILVQPGDFGGALEALEASGFRPFERNWEFLQEQMLGEMRLFSPSGGVVDLHWDLVQDVRLRRVFSMPARHLVERSRLVPLAGTEVATLGAADTFVHLALHASLAGGHRLVWLKDLERAAPRDRPGWDAVADRAGAWRAGPAVALMLQRLRATPGLTVGGAGDGGPQDGFCDLAAALGAEPSWRAVIAVTSRMSPVQRSGGGGSVARIVARAVRSTGRDSCRELLRRSGCWLRHGAGVSAPGVGELFDPDDPWSVTYSGHGEAGRPGYLAAVASAAPAASSRAQAPPGGSS